jgi:hypothetical protein
MRARSKYGSTSFSTLNRQFSCSPWIYCSEKAQENIVHSPAIFMILTSLIFPSIFTALPSIDHPINLGIVLLSAGFGFGDTKENFLVPFRGFNLPAMTQAAGRKMSLACLATLSSSTSQRGRNSVHSFKNLPRGVKSPLFKDDGHSIWLGKCEFEISTALLSATPARGAWRSSFQ